MEFLTVFINFVLHIDKYVGLIIENFGVFSYVILFFIVFVETGLVVMPFLPGDSLLFTAGAFAALGSFKIGILLILFWLAAFLGDNTNYWIGRFFGNKIITNKHIPISQSHIDKTESFYKKHGGKTVFLARFTPIVRTFSPFVAGIGQMDYKKFVFWSFLGSIIWTNGFVLAGYLFGNLPIVKENFSFVVIAIIILSISPILIEILKAKIKK